jgi:peptide/nickel transport system permease protein
LQRYILRRLITIVPTVIIVSLVSFSIILFLPGDPALAILGPERAADKEAYARIRQDMGLDRPVPIQYLEWAGKAVRGDLGTSVRNQQPVLEGIKERLPVTILLGACAMILGLLIALPVGIISAVRPNSKADAIGTIFALSGVAVPHFWLGILLIFLFGVTLRWLPPSGFVSPTENPGESLRLLLMPAFTLATGIAAVIMRQVRSALIEVMQNDYITTARAKGLREAVVVNRHALKNALIPVITIIGLQTGRLLGGAVVVEQIFAIPGVGRLAIDSINYRDFPMVQGVILVLALAVLIANLVTDVLYAYIDPRIRYT